MASRNTAAVLISAPCSRWRRRHRMEAPGPRTCSSASPVLQGDGWNATGVAVGRRGVVYAITANGGNSNFGTAFSLTPPATSGGPWTETVIHRFGFDEMFPNDLVMAPNGVLLGTTLDGGGGAGSLFTLTPPAAPGGSWSVVSFSFPEKKMKRKSSHAGGDRPRPALWQHVGGWQHGNRNGVFPRAINAGAWRTFTFSLPFHLKILFTAACRRRRVPPAPGDSLDYQWLRKTARSVPVWRGACLSLGGMIHQEMHWQRTKEKRK